MPWNISIVNMKLPYTIGFEMTALYRWYREVKSPPPCSCGCCGDKDGTDVSEHTLEVSHAGCNIINKKLPKKYKQCGVKAVVDQHCIEVPSPVFKSTASMEKFYLTLASLFKQHNFIPQHAATVCGGNHLHFGISDDRVFKNLVRDFTRRPSIPWVFTQPDDTDSCNNFVWDINDISLSKKLTAFGFGNEFNWITGNVIFEGETELEHIYLSNKINAISLNNLNFVRGKLKKCTIEFRCIEAPRSLAEFRDQYEFFIRYMDYIRSIPVYLPAVKPRTKAELQQVTRLEAAIGFNNTLRMLGLSPKRYEKYLKRNLYPRWELGRERV